jgi:hypothetical protein
MTAETEVITKVAADELGRDLPHYLEMVGPDAEGRSHLIEIEAGDRKVYLISEQDLGGYRTTIELLQDPITRDQLRQVATDYADTPLTPREKPLKP